MLRYWNPDNADQETEDDGWCQWNGSIIDDHIEVKESDEEDESLCVCSNTSFQLF